jgi:glycosyltransferase involved in cell wall biosynthesis
MNLIDKNIKVKRIGILCDGFSNWGGGIDFLHSIISSLVTVDNTLKFILLIPSKGAKVNIYNLFLAIYKRIYVLFKWFLPSPPQRIDLAYIKSLAHSYTGCLSIHEISSGSSSLAAASIALKLDVLLPSIKPLPNDFPVPWVGYICDLQHKYYPKFFSISELIRRNKRFKKMLRNAATVIVNARMVSKDISQYFPGSDAEIVALPFSAAPKEEWFHLPTTGSFYTNKSPVRYFIICNQFWMHKDHATAFTAFARVANKFPDLELICTGTTSDYRNPEYFVSLCKQLEDMGLKNRVRITGLIPKLDQIALLRGAVALIQPTLFEGGPGGGAVYDAVSLGVPCIVSDIEVNLELNEAGVRFFHAGDSADLALAMTDALMSGTRSPIPLDELRGAGERRRYCCGRALQEALNIAIIKFHNHHHQIRHCVTQERTK